MLKTEQKNKKKDQIFRAEVRDRAWKIRSFFMGMTSEKSFRNFSERVCEKERNFPTEYGTLKKSFRLPAGERRMVQKKNDSAEKERNNETTLLERTD